MEELDLKELFTVFWNKKIHIILIIILFIIIGGIYTMIFITPKYTSSTTLVLAKAEEATGSTATNQETTSITSTDITLNSKLVSTYSELVKSKNVLRKVISNLGIDVGEDDLRKNVTVSSVKDTEIIEITVANENASYAAKVANEIARVFTEKVAEIYNIKNVHIVDEAEVSNSPSNINHIKDIVIFAFIGIVIASLYVLIDNMLDTTVKSTEDIERKLDVLVLATIPEYNFDNDNKGGKRR